MKLIDSFNRTLDYLRISLTDRCNFRCLYCMPPEGIPLLPKQDILTIEEFERLTRIFASLGVRKIRLTGGEPLLRKKIVALTSALSHIEEIDEVNLTTNGSLLAPLPTVLKEAGLHGVNVSLDSLSRIRFQKITRADELFEVTYGITEALKAGLKVKLNVVALNDLSKKEVLSFCHLTKNNPLEVRFLELMPLCGSAWNASLGLSISLLKNWVMESFELIPLPRGNQVAETFQVEGSLGNIGFIASLSEPFCESCNRLRLTSTGALRSCLFSDLETDLRTPLRRGDSDEEIAERIQRAAWNKPKGHEQYLAERPYVDLPKIRTLGG